MREMETFSAEAPPVAVSNEIEIILCTEHAQFVLIFSSRQFGF